MEVKIYINENLGFIPYLNMTQLSIFNNELGLDVSLDGLIIMNIVIIIFLWGLDFLDEKKGFLENNSILKRVILFMIAGTSCSLIDKVVWGGSLDYILFFDWILDLKDIYLFIGVVLFFIAGIADMIAKGYKCK